MHPSQDITQDEIVKLPPENYQGGKEVTTRILKVLNLTEYRSLSDAFDISWGTISTWHRRAQTPFEIVVRLHLATGVSLRWLLLGEGEMYEHEKSAANTTKIELPYFILKNGSLISEEKVFFDPLFLEGLPDSEHLILLNHEGQKLFVDTSINKAISGTYLVKIDNDYTLNELQKIPGGKVMMNLNNNSYKVDEHDLGIKGKVIS